MSTDNHNSNHFSNLANPFIQQLSSMASKKQVRRTPHDIELAAAVVLLEVASCDDHATIRERGIIHRGLKELFNASDESITEVMAQARNHLRSMRGSSSLAMVLRDHLDPTSKKMILNLIDELINSDGERTEFEVYLRNRFMIILGFQPEQTASKLD